MTVFSFLIRRRTSSPKIDLVHTIHQPTFRYLELDVAHKWFVVILVNKMLRFLPMIIFSLGSRPQKYQMKVREITPFLKRGFKDILQDKIFLAGRLA